VSFVQRLLAAEGIPAKARAYDGPHPRKDDVRIDHKGGRDMLAGDVLRQLMRRGEAGEAWLREQLRRLL